MRTSNRSTAVACLWLSMALACPAFGGGPSSLNGLVEDLKKAGWSSDFYPVSTQEVNRWQAIEAIRIRDRGDFILVRANRGSYPERELMPRFTAMMTIHEDSSERILLFAAGHADIYDALVRDLKRQYAR